MSDVELQTTVDTTDATDEQVRLFEQMAVLFEERFELFVEKNIDYGSSFQTAGKVDMVLSDNGPFDSAETANLYKLFTRIQDKDQRFYQQVFDDGNDHVGEPASETAGDAAVYWLMINWILEYNDK